MKQSEARIQQDIFLWYWNTYCLPSKSNREIIFHVPNEGKDNGRLVPIGLYPGCSDLIISFKGSILFIEIKTPEGKQSPSQVKFQDHVEAAGYDYYLIRSLDEFKFLIESLE